jgi:hypothetical protein
MLFANLIKFYRSDAHLIFELMTKLGSTHSDMILKTYHKILGIDKKYLSKEPF